MTNEQPQDFRPPGEEWDVTTGQSWWVQVADVDDLTGRDVTATLWQSWANRTPQLGGETIEVRRDAGSVWVGQDTPGALLGGVFYVAIAPTPGADLVNRVGVRLRVKERGTRTGPPPRIELATVTAPSLALPPAGPPGAGATDASIAAFIGSGALTEASLAAFLNDHTPTAGLTYYGPLSSPPDYDTWVWWNVTDPDDPRRIIDVRTPA